MRTANPDTEELLQRAASGDPQARQLLLTRHRKRLRRMVAVRLDPRLAARLDPSDVVQEALAAAARQLDAYLRDRPLPFYPWLRRLAWERLATERAVSFAAGVPVSAIRDSKSLLRDN
jgi:RNA polymerase sigma-70 factor (ECF subfamily)